jgi:hypothetical protein
MIIMRESLQDRTVSSSWLVAKESNVLVSTHDTKRMVRITTSHIPAHDVHTFISNGVRSTAPYAPVTGGCRNKETILSFQEMDLLIDIYVKRRIPFNRYLPVL